MEDLDMNTTFWRGKKVLITGHTGFKGGWLSLYLQKKGANVVGYSLPPPTEPSLFEIGRIAEGMESISGDVRDIEKFKTIIREHKPEIIIHMAAQSLVRYSYENPLETYSTNVMGTVNVLESVRCLDSVKVVLIITSDKCYENKEWIWGYRENERMGGHDPYSSSKGCAELVTSAYINSYFSKSDYLDHGVAVASARAGNVIGGGDWGKDRLIPDIMHGILTDKPVVIRNPNAIRPWQHVLEPLSGYLCLAEKLWHYGPKFSGGWNFGPKDECCKPVSWILKKLRALWGDKFCWELDTADNPHEASFLKLDCTKARSMLSWFPKLNQDNTFELIVDWYQGYIQNKNMRELSEKQIALYEKMEP